MHGPTYVEKVLYRLKLCVLGVSNWTVWSFSYNKRDILV